MKLPVCSLPCPSAILAGMDAADRLIPMVLAVFALLGLASRTGLLTRLAAGFALLVMIAFAFTVANAGLSLGPGVFIVILGSVLALIGGVCGMVGKD